MARDLAVSPESFEEILAWLSANREIAATKYVQLRHDLAKIFIWRGCNDPEGLTDEVFDRVAKKVHEIRATYEGDPRLYFRAVANNLIKETLKQGKTHVPLESLNLPQQSIDTDERKEEALKILEACIEELSATERQLVLRYYLLEKHDRQKLSTDLAISYETLRVRVHRIRQRLKRKIERKMQIT
ncbi:MAG TPA: sigma-70 family RNA polymerase sigma factor [Pyrinomonadaceae bacterium]|nr:sigma-70 family RNA polymerase sigma factor [Pyrinomonadaceae bacterium]